MPFETFTPISFYIRLFVFELGARTEKRTDGQTRTVMWPIKMAA